MLGFGIYTALSAAFGGVFGAWLDQQVGPRFALMIEIRGALTCLLQELGTSPSRIFFFWLYHPRASLLRRRAIFITAPDLIYLLAGLGIGLFVTAHYASSRTLLTRLVDPEKLPAFFGLYAISGTATVWLGSLLIKVAAEDLGTQQAGFIPIVALLTFGLAGVWFVRGGERSLQPRNGTDPSPELRRPEASEDVMARGSGGRPEFWVALSSSPMSIG